MPLLCLDSATDAPVAALCTEQGELLAGGTVDGRAQGLLALIDSLVAETGIERSSIDAIVVGTGPGTFTGLRVGVSTARGLAEALGVPLHAASSLEVAAASIARTTQSAASFDVSIAAGRGECFVQEFSWGDDAPLAVGTVRVIAAADAPDPTTPTPDGLAIVATNRRRAALHAGDSGDALVVVPAYGREPDAAPPRIDVVLDVLSTSDLDALVAVEARCFDTPWTRSMYQDELDRPAGDAVRLAARDHGAGDRLVGAALAARIGDAWHVMNVLVDPSARGRGIARRLVAELLDRTRVLGAGEGWTLEVRDGNDAAIGLYEACGFEHAGRRRGYYQDTGEDALVMWRYATDLDRSAVHA